jgi:transposase-like protein
MEQTRLVHPSAFCWNPSCTDYGQVNCGNIRRFGRTQANTQRYQCRTCGSTFVETIGTVFYGRHHSQQTILECLARMAERNSLAAIHRVKGIKEETVVHLSDMVDNSLLPTRPDSCPFSRRSGTHDHPHARQFGPPRHFLGDRGPSGPSTPRLSGAKGRLQQWQRQEVEHPPAPPRQSGRHRRRPLTVALWLAFPTTVKRIRQRLPERLMRPHERVVRPPPRQIAQQLRCRLHRRPGPADERRHHLPQRQIHALDNGGMQRAAHAQCAEGRLERCACPAPHQIRDPH